MKDIKAEFLAELDSIEKEKAEVARQRDILVTDKTALEKRALDLELKEKEATKKISEAGGIDEVQALRASYTAKMAELEEELDAQKSKKVFLIRWENRLVEIENRQKLDLEKLTKGKEELDQDKKTYKEKLKTEFLEALKKQMPQ